MCYAFAMISHAGHHFFDTPLARCGIAWTERGIRAVKLTEGSARSARATLLAHSPGSHESAPPPSVRRAVEELRAHLGGEARDLRGIRLDEAGVPPFHRRVYEAARAIPVGETTSYGELAARLGAPGAARAVGQALASNPYLLIVPCHRILSSGGRLGGFSASGGVATKLRLLSLERAAIRRDALGYDLGAAVRHLRREPAMAALLDHIGPLDPRLRGAENLFDALASSIVHQQLSGKAAISIYARLASLYPHGHLGLEPRRLLRTSTESLRGVGLSGAKIKALRDLARKVVGGELPTFEQMRGMDDESIVERLLTVRGIGRWTVEMLLIFRLGRPDVWPVDDLGVRKGFALTYGSQSLPSPKELMALGDRFRPYRSAAALAFWRAADLQKASLAG